MLACAAVLAACGKKTSETVSSGTAGTQTQGQDNAGADAPAQNDQSAGSQAQAQDAGQADDTATYDAQNQTGDAAEENYDDEAYENQNVDLGWNGTFNSSSGESLDLASDGSVLTFAFANSGMEGTAPIEGQSAAYAGEDGHTITFTLSGDVVTVQVTSTQFPEGEESPLNGSYDRQ